MLNKDGVKDWVSAQLMRAVETGPSRKVLRGLVQSEVPGMDPVDLVAFYEGFTWYYPKCELRTKRWFVENVQSDWVCVDAGANVGYYAILLSRLARQGKVFAFEPTDTYDLLLENLRHSSITNCEALRLALGKTSGLIEERIFKLWGRPAEKSEFNFVSLDHFVQERRLARLDCIKIDVDSFDFEVLQGAEATLDQFNPWVVVELNHALNQRNQSNMQALEWLAKKGYNSALVLEYDNFVLRRGEGSSHGSQRITLEFGV